MGKMRSQSNSNDSNIKGDKICKIGVKYIIVSPFHKLLLNFIERKSHEQYFNCRVRGGLRLIPLSLQ